MNMNKSNVLLYIKVTPLSFIHGDFTYICLCL